MTLEPVTPELVAALLDGKLSPAERERVLAAIASSPETYEGFAEAAAIKRDMDVVPLRRRRAWRVAIPLLAAAALAIALLPRWTASRSAGSALGLLESLDRSLEAGGPATSLGSAWSQPGWSVVRGGSDALGQRSRAVRSGVRLVDVEAAISARDSAALPAALADLTRLVSGIGAGGPLADRYGRLSAAAPPARSARVTMANSLRSLLQSDPWFDLGCLLETARLSARAGLVTFFDSGAPAAKALEDIRSRLSANAATDPASARALEGVDRVRQRLRGGVTEGALREVESLIQSVIAAAAD